MTKKEGQVQIGKPPRLKPPRLAALESLGHSGYEGSVHGLILRPVILRPVIRIFRVFAVRIFQIFRVFGPQTFSDPYFLLGEERQSAFFPRFRLEWSEFQNAENPTDQPCLDRL